MKNYLFIILISAIFIGMIFSPKDWNSEEKIIFQIKKGQGSGEISANLQKQEVIGWGILFRIYAFFRGTSGKLQAGCYILSPSMNVPKIAGILSSGEIAKEKITIPEGFTSEQINERLSRTFLVGTRSVLDELKDYEGYLFPDTYEIPYCQEAEKIIKMMVDNFNRKTAGLKITPEVVVMASLLERELKTKEDKELTSGILWKRLKIGMPLQVDAHMWTYDNYGLPEKPIANPGLESIEAALHPKESSYWYYLSSSDGKTIFNKTLEEHNIAKAKYLR